MASSKDAPIECNHCRQLVKSDKYHEHINQHTQPHELVPRTLPNNLKKVGLSKVLHLDDSTNGSDIAVRSILPDEIPKPEKDKVDITREQSLVPFGKDRRNEKVGNARRGGNPGPDHLDLNSNIIALNLSPLDDGTLQIEKEVDLKPKKTMLAKKEVHKYQNTHNMMARESVDVGGCDKKVQSNSMAQSKYTNSVAPEPVYEIKEDVKPFLSLATDPKNTATVAFSRKTGRANQYNAINTKSVIDPNRRNTYVYVESSQSEHQDKVKRVGMAPREDRPYPLHNHQCPDCHGFYCSTCKSTIPPRFRPFWDQNQSPEAIAYYKSIQLQSEKEKRHCKNCNQKQKS